jgi:hypothetical protein
MMRNGIALLDSHVSWKAIDTGLKNVVNMLTIAGTDVLVNTYLCYL